MMPIPTSNIDVDATAIAHMHEQMPDEWNGQEPMRRRRRPGRKRKRRPQHHNDMMMDNGALFTGPPNNYWHKEDMVSGHDPDDGVMVSVSASQHFQNNDNTNWHRDGPNGNRRRAGQNWHINKNQYVHEQVVRVQEPSSEPDYVPPRRNERLPEAYPTQSMDQQLQTRPQIPHLNSYRKPYSVAKKEREEQQQLSDGTSSSSASNLKDLLKQSGGMSLSEILQQQNLSLDDLLKGKQNALKALQSTTASPSPDPPSDNKPNDWKLSTRRPPTPTYRPTVNEHITPSSVFSQVASDKTAKRRIPVFTRPLEAKMQIMVDDGLSSYAGSIADVTTTEKPMIGQSFAVTIANSISELAQRVPGSAINDRIKPIKEIVSAIRPDLNNLNTRKRLLPLTLKPNKTQTETLAASTEKPKVLPKTVGELNVIKPTDAVRLPPRYLGANRKNLTENTVISQSTIKMSPAPTKELVEATTAEIVSTIKPATTERTPDTIKDIIKSRLALRPKLRLPIPTKESTTSTTTELSVTDPQPTEEPTEMTTYAQRAEVPSSITPTIELLMDNYEPELNVIDDVEVPAHNYFDIDDDTDNPHSITSKMDSDDIDDGTERQFITENSIAPTVQRDVTERNPSLFLDITSSKSIDDRTDLLELLDDRRSGARLQKVLSQRNMTLEELIAHRQRGSSQLHLAEIFNNRTRSSTGATARSLPNSGALDIVTAFENFPTFNLDNLKSVKPDEIKTDSQGSSYFTSITHIKPTDEVFKEGRSLMKPATNMDMSTETHRNFEWEPPVYATRYGVSADNNYIETSNPSVVTSSRLMPETAENQYPDLVEFENDIDHPHDIIDLELSGYGFKRNTITVETAHPAQMPVGIRSAIIASSSIVGVSVMIFVVIFATCRWRQHRRKKITYNENFQAVRSRLPILTRQTSSNHSKRSAAAAPIIFPSSSHRHHHTNGNGSKLNTMDPNSPEVQEYLYDAMRKPF